MPPKKSARRQKNQRAVREGSRYRRARFDSTPGGGHTRRREGAAFSDVAVGISIRDLVKRYDRDAAVAIPALEVEPHRRMALLGASGAGKTTLLRLLLGLVAPDQGEIVIGGVPLTSATRRELRLRIGYVVQEGGLFPHLTARENVELLARDLGWDRARIRARVASLRELTGLTEPELDRFPGELSGGQRQRVGLMRALMLDPPVLLLDEPLGSLDPVTRSRLQAELRQLFDHLRPTMLVVTHDVAEAAWLGEEIALMRGGRIVQRGPWRTLVDHPADAEVSEFLRAQRQLPEAE